LKTFHCFSREASQNAWLIWRTALKIKQKKKNHHVEVQNNPKIMCLNRCQPSLPPSSLPLFVLKVLVFVSLPAYLYPLNWSVSRCSFISIELVFRNCLSSICWSFLILFSLSFVLNPRFLVRLDFKKTKKNVLKLIYMRRKNTKF